MTVKVMDFSGNLYSDEGFDVEIPENSSLVYYDTLQSALTGKLNPRELLLLVTLKGVAFSRIMVKNILYFVPPKDLELPVPEIKKVVTATPSGFNINLSCEKLVKNLYISTSAKGDFSNNYFDLLPGESVDVKFIRKNKSSKKAEEFIVKSLTDTY
jgi:beta-mannosidase